MQEKRLTLLRQFPFDIFAKPALLISPDLSDISPEVLSSQATGPRVHVGGPTPTLPALAHEDGTMGCPFLDLLSCVGPDSECDFG